MIRIQPRAIPIALAGLLLVGCSGGGAATPDSDEAAMEAVPTEEEADASAAASINPENAESELDDLMKELDSDPGGS